MPARLTLSSGPVRLSLHDPADGYYQGTRFDRAGVFESLSLGGTELCGQWFERYDPFLHDAVCGPAEEFGPVGFDAAAPGDAFLKPGVGMLRRPDPAPYDRFRLYEITDPGEREVFREENAIVFRHRLDGQYAYEKQILLTGDRCFEIRHSLQGVVPLETEVYNHNFFTFGRFEVGPEREMDFPFDPEGTWRAAYDSVAVVGRGLRFSRTLSPGESVYMGDLHDASGGSVYGMTVRERGVAEVCITGDAPLTRTVFWSNHRVACLEPYNRISITPRGTFHWRIRYELKG